MIINFTLNTLSTVGWAANFPAGGLLLLLLGLAWGLSCLWRAPNAPAYVGRQVFTATLLFGCLDFCMLLALPVLGLSFGPIPFAWLIFTLARVGVGTLLALSWRWMRNTPESVIKVGVFLVWAVNATLLGCAIVGLYIEPFQLSISHVTLPGAPQMRIVQLSDLHIEHITRRERDILAQLEVLQPDLIVLTGDYLNTSYTHDPQTQAEARDFLAQLHAPYGVYAINDYYIDPPDVMDALFDGLEITVLNNDWEPLTVGTDTLYIAGLERRFTNQDTRGLLAELLQPIPEESFTLLLYHTPDLIETAAEHGVDLYLAGHTHGGQIRLPFYGAVVTFSEYGKKYEMGRYTVEDTTLYVSRGLGMEGSVIPRMRFLCPPEIVVVDIQ